MNNKHIAKSSLKQTQRMVLFVYFSHIEKNRRKESCVIERRQRATFQLFQKELRK